VARLLAAFLPWLSEIDVTIEQHVLNGQPGAIFRDREGRVLNTWTVDILGGRIQAIRTVLNPEKLGHVGPVADAWAVLQEATAARHRPR
jgi:RNA polymerase sigma-70 factor (ECF subfamily)